MRALVSLLILAAAPGFSAEMERGVPLFFFPNTGLTDPSIRFIVETPQLRAGFRADSAVFQAGGGYLSVRFAGADPGVTIEGSETLPGKVNFIIGSDPRGWKANLPTYRSILYRGLYPGVDMIYGGAGRGIKSTFTVAPGADPSQIRLEYSAADHVAIDGHGDLLIEAAGMQLREEAPEIYQESGGGRVHIYGRYRMTGPRTIGFEIDAFDASQPLVIDPVISYCTYLGGSAMGAVTGLAVDAGGNLYVAGWTEALDFPIAGAIQAFNKGASNCCRKLNRCQLWQRCMRPTLKLRHDAEQAWRGPRLHRRFDQGLSPEVSWRTKRTDGLVGVGPILNRKQNLVQLRQLAQCRRHDRPWRGAGGARFAIQRLDLGQPPREGRIDDAIKRERGSVGDHGQNILENDPVPSMGVERKLANLVARRLPVAAEKWHQRGARIGRNREPVLAHFVVDKSDEVALGVRIAGQGGCVPRAFAQRAERRIAFQIARLDHDPAFQ